MSFLRTRLLKCFYVCLYYLRVLRLVSRYIDKFQPKNGSDGKQNAFPFITKRRSRNIQILIYHRVNDEGDPFFPAVPTVAFKNQMGYLAENFNVCSLVEAVERLKNGDIPEKSIVVTFDDGYRDNYLHAFPVLRQFSIPATIFLATGAIGSGTTLWHDRVFSAFRTTQKSILKNFGNPPRDYSLGDLRQKVGAVSEILWYLRVLSEQERDCWIDRLTENLDAGDQVISSDLMLTWEQVLTMHQAGICFGSHTVSHPILSKASSETVRREIDQSKKAIEEHLNTSVVTFAYPSGRREDFNDAVKAVLREAGYLCGVSTIFGANEIGQDCFELRRGSSWEYDTPSFAAKLAWYKFISRPLST